MSRKVRKRGKLRRDRKRAYHRWFLAFCVTTDDLSTDHVGWPRSWWRLEEVCQQLGRRWYI